MTETVKLIQAYGTLVFAAAFLASAFFIGKWIVKRIDKEHDEAREDRDAFHAAAIGFTQVVENHMTHDTAALEELTRKNTECFAEMTKMLERVCYHLQAPNNDYFKPGGTD